MQDSCGEPTPRCGATIGHGSRPRTGSAKSTASPSAAKPGGEPSRPAATPTNRSSGYAFAQYRSFSGEARRLFADAVELLSYIAKGEFRTALVTNGPSDVQRDHLRALGLQDCFGAVVISGELGVAKPDPAPFQVALERLEVDQHAAWHVGDDLATDVQGAQAAGVFAVWLNRAGTSPRPGGPHSGLEVVLKSSRSRR
jgi:HAD superfamily hydrolase (TIGR01549 family)